MVGAELFAGERRLVIVGSRPHQHRWLLRFDGVADRTAAEALQGAVLSAEPLEPGESELWVHEMVGCDVVDRSGARLGTVSAVEANPADDLLVLDTGALVPIVFVISGGTTVGDPIVVDVPDGLFDL